MLFAASSEGPCSSTCMMPAHGHSHHSHCESMAQLARCSAAGNRVQAKREILFGASLISCTNSCFRSALQSLLLALRHGRLWWHLGERNSIQVWPDLTKGTPLAFHTLTSFSKGRFNHSHPLCPKPSASPFPKCSC